MKTFISHWKFIIEMDPLFQLTWQQIAPYVEREFPRIFHERKGAAHIKTILRPGATTLYEITMQTDGKDADEPYIQEQVRMEIGGVFIPKVFGPRARLLAQESTVKANYRLMAEPADFSAVPGKIGRPC